MLPNQTPRGLYGLRRYWLDIIQVTKLNLGTKANNLYGYFVKCRNSYGTKIFKKFTSVIQSIEILYLHQKSLCCNHKTIVLFIWMNNYFKVLQKLHLKLLRNCIFFINMKVMHLLRQIIKVMQSKTRTIWTSKG